MRSLAGGRLPPLTRTALLSGLGAFLLSLIAFKPVAPTHDRAPSAGITAVLLSTEDPLAQRAELLDESLVFLPSTGESLSTKGGYQLSPEGTPFQGFPPRLRFEPNRRPDLPVESSFSKLTAPLDGLNPSNGDFFGTFSSKKAPLESVKPRSLHCLITPAGFGQGSTISIEVVDFPILNPSRDGIFYLKAFFGVDSLGLLGKPTIQVSSGDLRIDHAAVDWIGQQDWQAKLPPGLYQICIGP